MCVHKLKASESTGTYLVESPVTEPDILLMARQPALGDWFSGTVQGHSGQCQLLSREVVKAALEHNAAANVLAHNHSSGDLEPSQSDLFLTHKQREALNLVRVQPLNHIVVDHKGCVSLAEQGHL